MPTIQTTTLKESNKYRTFLIKGEPTTGKSWFCATCLPNPVFIDFDKNQQRLAKLPSGIADQCKFIDPWMTLQGERVKLGRQIAQNTQEIIKAFNEEYKDHSLVIDSATAFEAFLIMRFKASEKPEICGDLSWENGGYTLLTTYWEDFFSLLTKDLQLNNHVALIAHETSKELPVNINQPKGEKCVKYLPSFTGSKTKDTVEKYFTDVFRLYVDTSIKNKPRYMATTLPTQAFKALTSLGVPATFEVSTQAENIKKQLM